MIYQNFHFRIAILLRLDQQNIFHRITNKQGHITICKIMVTVEWHINLSIYISIFMGKPKVRCFRADILRGIYLLFRIRNRSIMTATAIVKNNITFLGPEFMTNTIILILTETWPEISSLHMNQPDSLLNIIPRPLVTEHRNLRIIW